MSYYKTVTFNEPFKLCSGATFPSITVAYETYGTLNKDKSNAIIVFHALTGDSHVAKHNDEEREGWWEGMVGPGKSYDTDKYFVICANVLGGCKGTTGPMFVNPKDGRPYGMRFPVVTIEDMVNAQVKLLDYFGIERVFLATGGSMGGLQVLQFCVSFPDRVQNAQILAATSRTSPQSIALNEVARQAIYADLNWQNGDYYGKPHPDKGLAVARMLGHITYLCEEQMQEKFGRRLQDKERFGFDFNIDFQVESYLGYNGKKFTQRFDANSLLYVTKAIDYFDISNGYASLDAAISRIKARVLVVSYSTDWLFPAEQSVELTGAMLKNGIDATYVNVDCKFGHDSFLLDIEKLTDLTRDFLSSGACNKSLPLIAEADIALEKRQDYRLILELIPEHASVLDLGCGNGELIEQLQRKKGAHTRGVDRSERNVRACIGKGLSVRQGDIEEGLRDYPDGEFDYVILCRTIAFLDKPKDVVREMLRVARRVIITFDNAGYWEMRTNAALGLGMGPALYSDEPRQRAITLPQFEVFAEQVGAKIEHAYYLARDLQEYNHAKSSRIEPNTEASVRSVLYILTSGVIAGKPLKK